MAPGPANEHALAQPQASMAPMDHSMLHYYLQQQQQQQSQQQPQQHPQLPQGQQLSQAQVQSQQSSMGHGQGQGQGQMPAGQPPWTSHPPMQPTQPYPSAMKAAPHSQNHHM